MHPLPVCFFPVFPFTRINAVPLSVAPCKRLSILVPSHLLGPRIISICTPFPGKETHFSPLSPRSLRIGATCVVYPVFLRYGNVWISVFCLHDKKVLRLLFICFPVSRTQWRKIVTIKMSFISLFSSFGVINVLGTFVCLLVPTMGEDSQVVINASSSRDIFYHVSSSFKETQSIMPLRRTGSRPGSP